MGNYHIQFIQAQYTDRDDTENIDYINIGQTNTNIGVDIINIWFDTEMRLECIQPHGTEWNFVDLHGHMSQFNAVQKSLQKVPSCIIFHWFSGAPASSEEEWGRQFVTKTGSSQQLINKNSVDAAGATIFIRTNISSENGKQRTALQAFLCSWLFFSPHCGKMNTLNTFALLSCPQLSLGFDNGQLT